MEIDLASYNQTTSSGSKTKQLFWISLFCFYFYVLFFDIKRGDTSLDTIKPIRVIAVLLMLCSVSVFWSNEMMISLKRLVFQVLFCFTVMTSLYYAIKHNSLSLCIRLLIIISILVGLISIAIGNGYWAGSFSGWARNKNVMGAYCLSLIILLLMDYKGSGNGKRLDLVLMAILIVFVVATKSKTSIALAFLLLAMKMFNLWLPMVLGRVYLFAIMLVFCAIPTVYYLSNDVWHLALYLNSESLTGRGFLWDSLYYDLFTFQKLLSGYGYASYFGVGETPFIFDDPYSYSRFINSAHNSYIELLTQLGAPLTMIVMLVVSYANKSINDKFINTLLTVCLVYGLMESFLLRDQHVIWLTFVLVLAYGYFKKGNIANESSTRS